MVLTAVSSTTPGPCTFPLPCSCPARTGHLYSTEIMKNSVAFSCSYQLAKCSMECTVLLHILSFSCIWGTHGTLRVSLLGSQGCSMVSAPGRWRRQLRMPPPPRCGDCASVCCHCACIAMWVMAPPGGRSLSQQQRDTVFNYLVLGRTYMPVVCCLCCHYACTAM